MIIQQPDTIVYHHSANASAAPQFYLTEQEHKARGFTRSSLGFHIGYHYILEHDGTIRQARQENEQGDHDVNFGGPTDLSGARAGTLNTHSIGICLAGDFTQQQPTPEQVAALHSLSREIQARWNIPDSRRFLHRETKPTACPGTDLRALIDALDVSPESLPQRLQAAQNALKFPQSPDRKTMLQRLIDRILKILHP